MLPVIAAALISAAAGVGSSAIGGAMAGKARKKQMGLYNDQIADLTAWRDTQANRNYFDSPAGRDFMNTALKQSESSSRTLASSAAITGESAESQIAKQGNVQSALAEAMSKTAAMGDLRSNQNEMSYQNMLMGLMGQKAGMYAGQAETGGNLVSSGGNMLSSSAPALAQWLNKDNAALNNQNPTLANDPSVPYTGQDWVQA
jgi:hypothetical protein